MKKKLPPCRICTLLEGQPSDHLAAWNAHTDTNITEAQIKEVVANAHA